MPIVPAKIVYPSAAHSPVIAHVPHAATAIPDGVRPSFLVDDATLQHEIARLTDWRVDHLFSWVLEFGGVLFVGTHSRLAFDPERFADDDPTEAVGQGVVYTHTTTREPLAHITPEERGLRIRELYEPYHDALTGVVAGALERYNMALILDCHSYPTEPVPTETQPTGVRPDICIGTDDFHTPPVLADSLECALTREGFTVQRNSPFAGTLTPLQYLGKDPRVMSVMIEVRRDLYCDEATGEPNEHWGHTRALLRHCVGWAVKETIAERERGGLPE